MDQLTHWVQSLGGFISPKIEIKSIPGCGNSVLAVERIYPNEKLISLPRNLLINIQTLDEPELTSHQALAKYLLKNTSLWIDSLPQHFESIPVCWSDSEIDLLPRKYKEHVIKQKVQVKIDHQLACPDESFDRFLWAWLCVNSRCLYWDVGRERQENMTMAPFIDFLNHDCDQSKTVQVKTGLNMTVFASTAYEPGSEICLNYGPHENAFLLCEYGFTVPQNKWDYVDLTPELEPLLKDHETILKSLGYWGDYTIDSEGPSFRTLVACEALNNSRLDLVVNGLREPDPWPTVLIGILKTLKERYSKTTEREEINSLFNGYLSIIHASISKLGT